MTCCPNQVGHEPSAATNRINIFWDRTLFYTAFCTKIKFFMILEVLEAKGTFLQWKTTSGHRRKWKCEDIYLSLILAIFDPCPILTGPSRELLLPHHLNRPESTWSFTNLPLLLLKHPGDVGASLFLLLPPLIIHSRFMEAWAHGAHQDTQVCLQHF